LNSPTETHEAAVSFRALMEIDVDALVHRRQDRHLHRVAQRTAARIAEADAIPPGGVDLNALPDEIRAALGCRSAETLTLDFEFEITARQALRVGFYVRRGLPPAEILARVHSGTFYPEMLQRLCELGYIYDPRVITDQERRVIEHEAQRMGRALKIVGLSSVRVSVYTIEHFNRFVWQKYAEKEEHDCTIIGHNLPVDLARQMDPADVRAGTRDFTGGFSCGLRWDWQDETYRNKKGEVVQRQPPRRLLMRHIGTHKDFIHLARRFPGDWTGQFLNTIRVAQALFGPGNYRLSALARQLKLPRKHWKLKAPDYGGPITPAFLRYLRRDVCSTEAVFFALAEHYDGWQLEGRLHDLFSVASIGKRLLKKIGIPATEDRQIDLSPVERGWFLATYSGGRVETNCRLQIVRGQYRDFRSLYPLVNAIQNLQRFLLAERITSADAQPWVRDLLATHTPTELKAWCLVKEHWPQLQVIVKFRPNGKLPLPTRADYSHSGTTSAHNMGDNCLRVPEGLPEPWFTLVDLIAGIIRSPFLNPHKPVLGQVHMPTVLAARELMAEGRITTRPVDLFGYRIDLNDPEVGLFARLIDLRGEVQARIKRLKPEHLECWDTEAEYLDGVQQAFKLVSNATAYGILVEFLVDSPKAERPWVRVHSLTSREGTVEQIEKLGEYAIPEVGTFITGGARLMVALAEEMCLERGMGFAYVDTDGMFVEQPGWEGDQPEPGALDDTTFQAWLDEVGALLQPLNPFEGDKPIWKIEDENYAPNLDTLDAVTDRFEPLYGVFVCDKRGALFNLLASGDEPDGINAVRIRKFSGHGLGLWGGRHDYHPPQRPACPIPDPWTRSEALDEQTGQITIRPDAHKLKGGARWVYALWHDFLWTLANGRYPGSAKLEHANGQPRYVPTARDNPAWARPAYYQQTLSTWEVYEQYGAVEGRLPYNFVTAAPSPVSNAERFTLDRLRGQVAQHRRWVETADSRMVSERDRLDPLGGRWEMVPDGWDVDRLHQLATDDDSRYQRIAGRAVYTAYCDSDAAFLRAWEEGRVLVRGQGWKDKTGSGAKRHGPAEDPRANQPVPAYLRPRPLVSVLSDHFLRPETKRAGGRRAGWNDRLEVVATRYHYIGKESELLAEERAEETDFQIAGERSIAGSQELAVVRAELPPERGEDGEAPDAEIVRAMLAQHPNNSRLAQATGLSLATLKRLRAAPAAPRSAATWRALLAGAAVLDAERAADRIVQ
jgi:hypothetical protein